MFKSVSRAGQTWNRYISFSGDSGNMSVTEPRSGQVTLRIYCQSCKRNVEISVVPEIIDKSDTFPVSHAHLHGNPPHVITVYLDRQLNIRGSEVSDIATVERERKGTPLSAMVLLSVPPRLKRTALAMLKLHQGNPSEVARVTGKTRQAETQYLGMMFRMGYLERVRLGRTYQYRIPALTP
jgi:hypothetical protein